MMRRAIVLLILWAVGWCGCLAAQVQGTVRSDKGEPLAGAMVKAVGADGGVLAYAIAETTRGVTPYSWSRCAWYSPAWAMRRLR